MTREVPRLAAFISDSLVREAVALLQALIRTDTANPGKPEEPAARLVADFLGRHGIQAQLLAPTPARTSVVARVTGTDPNAPALLLLSHLDTVPAADPAAWTHPPFSGDEADGFVWGRGALDDKGRTAINAAALTALRANPPPGDILFAAVADEEEAGRLGAGWLRKHHPEVLQAPYALGEGGGYRTTVGRREFYTYAVAEKGAFRLRLRFKGAAAGHAAVPGGARDVATVTAQAATMLTSLRWPWTPTEAAVQTLRNAAEGQPATRGLALRALASRPLGPVLLRRGLGLAPEQREALWAMFHTTIALTMISAGHGAGVLPDEAEALFAVRYPPAEDRDAVVRRIERALSQLPLRPEIRVELEVPPRTAPTESALATAMRETMARLDPGVGLLPTLLPASTDLRELEEGTVAYGFTPMRRFTSNEAPRLVHGIDERIAVEDVAFGIEATVGIARRVGVRTGGATAHGPE
jgi:acetylornithine deacetylase/succinyl-diaminopimelate desuccinylase-like protein